ncbi:MAG: cytochrome b/b6 domain-containing protein [Candidatus Aminicenantaceae bacterium]
MLCHSKKRVSLYLPFLVILICFLFVYFSFGQEEGEFETIDSETCVECHEKSEHETVISDDISHSAHEGMECLDCHHDKGTMPHKEDLDFQVDWEGCIACHEDEGKEYTIHGRVAHADDEEIPTCSDCHGDHDIVPSTAKLSRTNPINLPKTCGICHTNLDLIERHQIRTAHPPGIYESSIHGRAVKGGVVAAATCNDCHSGEGTAHKIYSQGHPNSSINHFNIPDTCGQCHEKATKDYWTGIHGQLIKRGDAKSPVCTNCHGEHGIISPKDPRSPVSRARLAEATCTPCHESITLTERYGISTGRRPTFIDNYHGLKTKAGDLEVANCASCHGVHLILASSTPESRVHPGNLESTCGECHPGITSELAATPIHGFVEGVEKNKVAEIVKIVYILAIVVIIGLMALHWILDLWRQIILVTKKPQVRRMWANEVWQHTLLMVSFIILVITGFALRYGDSWFARFLFGWDHGFTVRGIIHRVAAVVMVFSTLWHMLYLLTRRGRRFLKDMMPNIADFRQFVQRILFNLGLSKKEPRSKRFSYVEKAEYWALVWGNAVMIITGILLWFDNYFVGFLPKGFLDVALVIHFYEAILASLAILIWHLYSTVFSPHVYPMNPSWLTGKMPKDMFEHEHPDAEAEEVKK